MINDMENNYYLIGKKENGLYYQDQTFNGLCFKDENAFLNDRNAICYIREAAFPYGKEYCTEEEAQKYGFTHNSIFNFVKEAVEYYDNDEDKPSECEAFIEYLTDYIFDTVDWQGIDMFLNELDIMDEWDCYKMEYGSNS